MYNVVPPISKPDQFHSYYTKSCQKPNIYTYIFVNLGHVNRMGDMCSDPTPKSHRSPAKSNRLRQSFIMEVSVCCMHQAFPPKY